jgi:hypothetical protein
MDGLIRHHRYKAGKEDQAPNLQLLEAIIIPLGEDLYVGTRSGRLRIKASIKPIKIEGLEQYELLHEYDYGDSILYEDALTELYQDELIGYAQLGATTRGMQRLLLCLGLTWRTREDALLQDRAETLVLPSVGNDEYKRIGVGFDINAGWFDGCEPE